MTIKKEITIFVAIAVLLVCSSVYGTLVMMTDAFSTNKRESQSLAKQIMADCNKLDVLVGKLVALRDSKDLEGITLPGTDRMATVSCVQTIPNDK